MYCLHFYLYYACAVADPEGRLIQLKPPHPWFSNSLFVWIFTKREHYVLSPVVFKWMLSLIWIFKSYMFIALIKLLAFKTILDLCLWLCVLCVIIQEQFFLAVHHRFSTILEKILIYLSKTAILAAPPH